MTPAERASFRPRDIPPGTQRVMEPAVLDAIEAEFALAVYDASRLARLQMLGLEPPPIPSVRALALWRRAKDEATA